MLKSSANKIILYFQVMFSLVSPSKVKTYTTLGDRVFQVAAPKLWNNVPFILEVHYFYHLLRKYLRRIFLEKHFLKYFNCLHNVYSFSLDIKAFFF